MPETPFYYKRKKLIKNKNMVTREQLEEAFGEDTPSFKVKDIDHDVVAISLLRERIPYESCKSIICGAEHDQLFLCGIEKVLPYLSEADLLTLSDCNMCIDKDNDCLFLFV